MRRWGLGVVGGKGVNLLGKWLRDRWGRGSLYPTSACFFAIEVLPMLRAIERRTQSSPTNPQHKGLRLLKPAVLILYFEFFRLGVIHCT